MSDSFVESIEKLAAHIAAKATDEKTSLDEAINAMKALTGYYALLKKHEAPDESDAEGGIEGFSDELEQFNKDNQNGSGTRLHNRKRRSRAATEPPAGNA